MTEMAHDIPSYDEKSLLIMESTQRGFALGDVTYDGRHYTVDLSEPQHRRHYGKVTATLRELSYLLDRLEQSRPTCGRCTITRQRWRPQWASICASEQESPDDRTRAGRAQQTGASTDD